MHQHIHVSLMVTVHDLADALEVVEALGPAQVNLAAKGYESSLMTDPEMVMDHEDEPDGQDAQTP